MSDEKLDPVLAFFEGQKETLRAQFRTVKGAMDADHNEWLRRKANFSKELETIKSKLALLDSWQGDRLKEVAPSGPENPMFPSLGRFKNMKAQEAILELFKTEPPHSKLSATDIVIKLEADGFEANSDRPVPIIFTTCKRLCDKRVLREHMDHGNRRTFSLSKH